MIPVPVAMVTRIANDLWGEYELRRYHGSRPDEALDDSLVHLIPEPDRGRVMAFLRGDLDTEYALSGDGGGQALRAKLLELGESSYERVRCLPDWPPQSN